MMKVLGSPTLSLCFCLPGWAAKHVASVDNNAIEQEIRNAVRDLQIQLPELLKASRINIQIPEIRLHIPEIQVPEIHIPEIHVQVPLDLLSASGFCKAIKSVVVSWVLISTGFPQAQSLIENE